MGGRNSATLAMNKDRCKKLDMVIYVCQIKHVSCLPYLMLIMKNQIILQFQFYTFAIFLAFLHLYNLLDSETR